MTGTIKRVNLSKGYAFLTATGQDYFIHRSEMVNQDFELLWEGAPVEFEGVSTPKGLRATRVVRR
jgi:cold shock protein